jgi:hypothetical protein
MVDGEAIRNRPDHQFVSVAMHCHIPAIDFEDTVIDIGATVG